MAAAATLFLSRAAAALSTSAAAARARLGRPNATGAGASSSSSSNNASKTTRLVHVALCVAALLALCIAASSRVLARESDAARTTAAVAASSAWHQRRAAKNASARAVATMEAERAALSPGARVAVDPDALRAARECGDAAVAALADELERLGGGGWPLAVARAQMRAALDLASAGAMLREAAEAEAQDQEERRLVEERFAEAAEAAAAEAALQQSDRWNAKARRRRLPGATATTTKGRRSRRRSHPSPAAAASQLPEPPRPVVREHRRGWRFAQRAAALLTDRAAKAVGSLAPIPCGGGGGDPSLPGPPVRQRSLLAVTMARDLDSGVGAGGAASGNTAAGVSARDSAAAAASARNAGWQAVRLAAGTPHGRLAVSVAVLMEEEQKEEDDDNSRRRRGRGRKGGGTAAAATAASVRAARAAERARHLRAAAALLRLARAPLGVECRAAELLEPAAAAAATPAAVTFPEKEGQGLPLVVAAAAAVAAARAPGPVGGPQPPFVGPGAALARNAAVDAYFSSPDPSAADAAPSPSPFAPDAVLFADARAFFCAEDAFRLLSYPAAGVDLACALPLVDEPFQPSSLSLSAPASLLGAAADADGDGAAGDAAAAEAARAHPDVPSRLRLRSLRADGAADAARDLRGSALAPLPPFLVHADSAALARLGQPAPARCCWGGLARLAAWPLRRGLRFRAGAADGACARPFHEASALCGDLHRLSIGGAVSPEDDGAVATAGPLSNATAPGGSGSRGPARILLDPAVRSSTQARVRRALAHPRFPYYYYTRMELGSWLDVRPLLRDGGAGAVFWPGPGVVALGGMWQPSMTRVACCEAPPAGWRPSLAGDCRPVDAGAAEGEGA